MNKNSRDYRANRSASREGQGIARKAWSDSWPTNRNDYTLLDQIDEASGEPSLHPRFLVALASRRRLRQARRERHQRINAVQTTEALPRRHRPSPRLVSHPRNQHRRSCVPVVTPSAKRRIGPARRLTRLPYHATGGLPCEKEPTGCDGPPSPCCWHCGTCPWPA